MGETCRPPSTDPPSFVGRLLHEQRPIDRAAVGCVHSGWAGDGTTRAAWFQPALLPLSLSLVGQQLPSSSAKVLMVGLFTRQLGRCFESRRAAKKWKGANIHTSTRVVSAPGGRRTSGSPAALIYAGLRAQPASFISLSAFRSGNSSSPPVPCLAHQHHLARVHLPNSISNLQSVSLNKLPISWL